MQPEDNNNQTPNRDTGYNSDPPAPQPAQSPEVEQSRQTYDPMQPGPVYGSVNPAQDNTDVAPSSSGKKRKLLIAIVAVTLVLVAGSAGAYFGVYVPNKPENAWKKSLENTATGYDKLIEASKDQSDIKGRTLKGTYKMDGGVMVADGSIDIKQYEKNSVSKVDFGTSGVRINLDIMTTLPEGSKNPDVYAKLNGLKGLDQMLGTEAGGLGAAVASFDNQWFVVDHTFFDQMEKNTAAAAEDGGAPSLATEDYTAIAEAVGRVNREYLFTTNPDKAVLTVVQNVGKEEMDGRSVYHYKVGYKKDRLKAYATAMKDELKKTKVGPYITDEDFNDLLADIGELNGDGQADAWVDMKTKTIRKMRFLIDNKPDNYIDIGLNYTGGDEVPFIVSGNFNENNEETSSFAVNVTLNTKTDVVKVAANIEGKDDTTDLKFNLDATIAPSEEKVEFTKPENVKSLLEALGPIMEGLISAPASLEQELGTIELDQL